MRIFNRLVLAILCIPQVPSITAKFIEPLPKLYSAALQRKARIRKIPSHSRFLQ